MKKIASIFLALLLIIGLVTMSLAEEKPVITVAIQDKMNVENFNTNLQTLQLEEACGVDLEMVVLPATDYTTNELLNWIDSGILLPLLLPSVIWWGK